MSIEKTIGRRIREKLDEKDLRAKDLAEYLGVTESAMSNYINNKRNIDNASIVKIANFLNVSIDELLCVDNTTSNQQIANIKEIKEAQNKKLSEAISLFNKLSDSQKDIILNLSKDLIGNNKN